MLMVITLEIDPMDLGSGYWIYQMVNEIQSPILGAEPNSDEMFHRACASAIEDAVLLIEMISEQGFFDEMPQHSKGPAG